MEATLSPLETLAALLCGPDGKCSIAGSDEDRRLIDGALAALAAAQSVPEGGVGLHARVEDLFGRYWDIAYDEARNGINLAHKANSVLYELRTLLAASAPTVGGEEAK